MKVIYFVSLIKQIKKVNDLIDLYDDGGRQRPQLNPIKGPAFREKARQLPHSAVLLVAFLCNMRKP